MSEHKYVTRNFSTAFLQSALCDDEEGLETISDKIEDTGRWSIHHYWIFKYEGKFYGASYSVGATEYQDESPFENDGDMLECTELQQVTKTITDYEPVKALS